MNSCEIGTSDLVERRNDSHVGQNRAMLRDYPDVMDINHVSQILGVSTKTSYAMLRSGQIAHLKIGRAYRIPKIKLIEYLNGANH